ncbi:GntP family permease [Treponema sp. Marseille-Q4130]|uniref:GntP family permease n=1 Tax=Treponema sp. Marseille-Q4130 TaxID=2766702 RepID=UPI001652A757|nr:GntP family permease [Treponema sp. Marseille-Q4130]MBC6719274.1 GntP family permease [Treponema sp. Marseille-Q4130]
MSGAYMLAVIIVAVVAMILAISKLKIHPFIVMTVIAIAVGLLCGMNTEDVINKVKAGFGNILASIGIVILAGTIIGTILEKTGAALTMANTILKLVGKERSVLTMGLTGYVTGIPVFCDSGFVILSPISRALAAQSNKSLAVMATALSAGLYATHCLVPPTPGPIAMAGTLNANLGLVIGIGLLISLPATFMGILYANKVAGKIDIPANPEYTVEELVEKYGKLPGPLHSFAPILVPIILIALKSIGDFPSHPFGTGAVKMFFSFIGNPVVALLLGIGLATTLIPKSEKKSTLSWVTDGVTNSAGILAITGAGGAFGEILKSLPLADALSSSLLQMHVGVFLPFIIAAILKSAMGASTVAMILTSAMVAPLMPALGFTSEIGKVLVIMAIGAGSMTVSHANDSYFWVVSQFSDMNTQQAYKCQTGVTLVQGITTIIVVFIVSLFVH